jgi:hypothetical protein
MAGYVLWLKCKGLDVLRGIFRKPQSDCERVLERVSNVRRRQLGRDRDVEVIELLPAA